MEGLGLSADSAVLALGGAAFILFLILHIAWFRYLKPTNASLVFLGSYAAGDLLISAGIIYLIMNGAAVGHSILILFASGFLFTLLVFHYLAWVFGMGEAAIRIRLLFEVAKNPNGITLEELFRDYHSEGILATRLDRLVRAGHVQTDGNFYWFRGSLLFLQHGVSEGLKRLLGISTRPK